MKFKLAHRVYWESEEDVNISPLPEYRRTTVSNADMHSDGWVTIAFGIRQFGVARWRDARFAVNSPTL
jgi:hypothetical protein